MACFCSAGSDVRAEEMASKAAEEGNASVGGLGHWGTPASLLVDREPTQLERHGCGVSVAMSVCLKSGMGVASAVNLREEEMQRCWPSQSASYVDRVEIWGTEMQQKVTCAVENASSM
jgi:hypothetical protein